eukprot:5348045-Prymnesium_polylepis.1
MSMWMIGATCCSCVVASLVAPPRPGTSSLSHPLLAASSICSGAKPGARSSCVAVLASGRSSSVSMVISCSFSCCSGPPREALRFASLCPRARPVGPPAQG